MNNHKLLILNVDSINGYLACGSCEKAFLIKDGIPSNCPDCGVGLWGIHSREQKKK